MSTTTEVKIDGEEHLILRESDVLAVVAELVRRSGRFTEPTVALRTPPGVGDPLYAVVANRLP